MVTLTRERWTSLSSLSFPPVLTCRTCAHLFPRMASSVPAQADWEARYRALRAKYDELCGVRPILVSAAIAPFRFDLT